MTGERLVSPMVVFIIYFANIQLNANHSSHNCRISEFHCKMGTAKCIAIDKFCNGVDDCGDKSDEPPYCSRKFAQININECVSIPLDHTISAQSKRRDVLKFHEN